MDREYLTRKLSRLCKELAQWTACDICKAESIGVVAPFTYFTPRSFCLFNCLSEYTRDTLLSIQCERTTAHSEGITLILGM